MDLVQQKIDYFHHEIGKKIAKTTFDVGYSNDSGVRELVENAGKMMGEIELDAERQVMNDFLSELVKPHPKAAYGEKMIREALEQGAVGRLLISEGLRKKTITYQCGSCDTEWTVSVGREDPTPKCPSCKASSDGAKELKNISIIEELGALAAKSNTEIVYISVDTEEGSQLMLGFSGLAGICRYPMM